MRFLKLLFVALWVAYPFAVFMGMRTLQTTTVSLFLLVVLSADALLRRLLRPTPTREPAGGDVRVDPLAGVRTPLFVAATTLLAASWLSQRRELILMMPVLINVALLTVFATSLLRPISIIEQLARLTVSDLSRAERAYCRGVTVVWSCFFLGNACVTAALAWFAPLNWWTLYTGCIAYLCMGLLFTGEYLLRKVRFRRFGRGLHDRVLAALLPDRREAA